MSRAQTATEEILRRGAVFREQAGKASVIPLLALPEAPDVGDGCLSCGTPVDPGHYRCELSALAVTLALDGGP